MNLICKVYKQGFNLEHFLGKLFSWKTIELTKNTQLIKIGNCGSQSQWLYVQWDLTLIVVERTGRS